MVSKAVIARIVKAVVVKVGKTSHHKAHHKKPRRRKGVKKASFNRKHPRKANGEFKKKVHHRRR